jgi:hypothetical protein
VPVCGPPDGNENRPRFLVVGCRNSTSPAWKQPACACARAFAVVETIPTLWKFHSSFRAQLNLTMKQPECGSAFYILLKVFFPKNLQAANQMYPNLDAIVVKGEVIKETADSVVCSFPAMLKVYTLKKEYFTRNRDVYPAPKPSHKVLSLRQLCKAEKVNIFTKCQAFYRELAIIKAQGVKVMKKVQNLKEKNLKTGKSFNKAMLKSVREHVLMPLPNSRLEKQRKSLLSSLVIVSDLGSYCLHLNNVCSLIASKIRAAMWNRHRHSGTVPSRGVNAPSEIVNNILTKYLLVSGFVVQAGVLNHGCFSFKTQSLQVVEKAFGGAENAVSGRDPFMHVSCVKSDEAFSHHKQVLGIDFDSPVICDPRAVGATAKKVIDSLVYETGRNEAEFVGWGKGKLIDVLFKHRLNSRSYLGLLYVHFLVVDNEHPFEIHIAPSRVGFGHSCIKFTFQVSKSKAIFTIGEEPTLEPIY